jgi:NADPH:quinone reductase
LSGAAPAIDLHRLFAGSLFVTKYNGSRWVAGFHEFAGLIAEGLAVAQRHPAAISEVAARFPLDRAADAYRALESNARGKILVLPRFAGFAPNY